jgi:hypothetical protein
MTMEQTFYTVDGSTTLELYVARVTTGENGMAAPAALRAQAIAARTFVLRAMRDDSLLGTYKKPISNSTKFQVYAQSPSARATLAASETAGMVCRYQGELILCNYVAGALWTAGGKPGADPTATEKWVTYNEGKTGAAVKPSFLSNTSRSDNRGCKSQNGADWLARHGYDHPAILRYFYGADLEVGPLHSAAPSPGPVVLNPEPPPATTGAPSGSPLPLFAVATLAKLAMEG